MIELKPCFSCGAQVRWCGENNPDPSDDHLCHQIQCDSCGMNFTVEPPFINQANNLDELQAIVRDRWNTRAS